MDTENQKYIAALDVGTTTIRCFIYNTNVTIIGTASDQVQQKKSKLSE